MVYEFDKNVYYNPEENGLTKLGEWDRRNENHEFDLLVLWKRNSDGRVLMGTDAGCSCPSPFEDQPAESLEPATPDAIREWFTPQDEYDKKDFTVGPTELKEALDILATNMKGV